MTQVLKTPIRVGEGGKPIRINAGFDLSGFTSLEITFYDPDANPTTVTNASDPAVSAPAVAVNDEDLGQLNANEYFEYTFATTLFDEAGTWYARAKYIDTGADPDDTFISDRIEITVKTADATDP